MADKKVIAVLGATGAQGGGLARAILADNSGEFTVRAITRNVDSDKAKALAEMGAEVVAADIDDYESLKNAFTGAHGVFAVTNFWEHFSPEKEIAQAASIAKAAKETNVKHVIWSSLDDTRKWVPINDNRMPTLQKKYKVPHFNAKGESNKYFNDFKKASCNAVLTNPAASASSRAIKSPISTCVTWQPRRTKVCANSQPIGPPPNTNNRSGRSVNDQIVSDV